MVSKQDFKKISDWLWEVPKSFRSDMRVPARIYASEKILDHIENHALKQLVNITTLPGIVKYAVGMPDLHSGYGPPIGGVGAMKIPEGIISPGFVGYDENCLPPDSKVLLENGTYISIRELGYSWNSRKVKVVNFEKKKISDVPIIHFFKRYNNPTIYQIVTEAGEKIKATGNHPIQTKEGMKEMRFLNSRDEVLIYPFKGVKYEESSKKILLDEEHLKKVLVKLGRINEPGHAITQILNQLKSRNLLPLSYNSSFLPSILRIIGYIFGDGSISFSKNAQIQFYGDPEDLREIQKDISKLGFKPSRIYSRKRDHSITTFYRTYEFSRTEYVIKNGSASLASLLIALGTPYGLKAHQAYRIPKWIFNCPLWQKRLFLASFFGAELSAPSTLNKYNFYAPTLNMNKSERLKENAKLFLKDIVKLLKEFNIQTSQIKEVPGYRYKGKLGNTTGFRLQIKENAENVIKLFETIGYEYNRRKQKEACLAANYLRRKLKVVTLRTQARKGIRNAYKKKGDFKKLIRKYSDKYTPPQFLYHSLFKENRWGIQKKRGNPRIAFNFPSFKEYKRKHVYKNQGLVWEKIERIEKIPYAGLVYDFTVNHPDHNFVANNFVVSNCGVRLLKSNHTEKEIKARLENLATEIQKEIPSGLGKGRQIKLSINQVNKILEGGVPELVRQGYGEEEDIENCEEKGKMEQADASCVSERAKNRGRNQVGTLGSGNHFCEIQKVEEIFDEKVAQSFGLFKDQVVVMIHSGSRGLGHQNCTDYLRVVMQALPRYGIRLPDRELACVPFNSPEGQRFFKAMCAACNYAWANRHMMAFYIKKVWKKILGEKENLKLLYDVAHNIAKIEEHEVNGEKMKLIVHRKGATRAFPPGHPEIPEKYRGVGQPVLIPGSMGTASYVLAGTEKSKEAWYTVNHGAGRTMSRREATRRISGQEVIKRLEQKGIIIKCWSPRGIAEEAPIAYKDIDNVVQVVHNAGLSKKVARLVPLAVIKGE